MILVHFLQTSNTLQFFTNYCNFWHRIFPSHTDQFNGAGRRCDGRCVVMLAEERNDKYNCNSVSTARHHGHCDADADGHGG